MNNTPMTQEQLDAIEVRLGCDTPTTEDVSILLAEVERLRALTTVDEDMVERGARAMQEEVVEPVAFSWDNESERTRRIYRRRTRAALNAALGTGEGS